MATLTLDPTATPETTRATSPQSHAVRTSTVLASAAPPAVNKRTTTGALVVAAQGGDRDAWSELFNRYHEMVIAVARRRVGDIDLAEELAQDVFVQAMQKLNQLRVPDAFGGWLRQITVRLAINRLTRGGRAMACDPETLAATCLDDDCPVTNAQDQESAGEVRHRLSMLGAIDRQTLDAFYLRHKSLVEMSDEFDAPIGTIKRRLHVARKRLAAAMQ